MDRDEVLTDWLLLWDCASPAGRMIVLEAFSSEHREMLPDYLAVIRSLDVCEPLRLSRFRLVK